MTRLKLTHLLILLLLTARAFAANPTTTESRTVAYLGVTAKSVDDTLRAQLDLPDGVGVIVTSVDHKGPCADDIQLHDVLQKLDDQVLTDAHQFVTLIRLHKPGDTVTLSLIRQAKPETVKITLGEKKLSQPPPDARADAFPPGFTPEEPNLPFNYTLPGTNSQVAMSFQDDVYSANVHTDAQGHRQITVRDRADKVVAQGPVDNVEEWGKLPADIRSHLDVMKRMLGFDKPKPDDAK
jgi:hypothetical protein